MEFTAKQIADYLGGKIDGNADTRVSAFSKIEEGKTGSLTFLYTDKYEQYLYDTEASIVLVPADFKPSRPVNATLIRLADPREAVAGAHLVSTDVWASMGQEDEAAARIALFRPYQVNAALLDGAADDVLFMHCLPAHRGEEISEELLDDPRSVAWDQAENRLHAQKALLELLIEHAHYA